MFVRLNKKSPFRRKTKGGDERAWDEDCTILERRQFSPFAPLGLGTRMELTP